ncbi:MAG: hypothetical protein ACTHMM_13275 [Agriterribacter sp.]
MKKIITLTAFICLVAKANAQWTAPSPGTTIYSTDLSKKVGIGTSTPGTKLHIVGTGVSLVRIENTANAANNAAAIDLVANGGNNNAGIRCYDGSTFRWELGQGGTNNFSLYNGTTNNYAFAVDRLTSAFTHYGDGDLIINRTTQDFLKGIRFNESGGGERAFVKLNGGSGEFRIGTTAGGYYPTFYSNGVERMRITTAGNVELKGGGDMIIYSNNVERMKIATAGNVELQGDGDLIINRTTQNFLKGIRFNESGGGERAFVKLNGGSGEFRIGTTAGGYYPTFYSNGVERMMIATNGNVGIGTQNVNNPDYKLFVEAGVRTRKVKVDQATWPDYVFDNGYKLRPLQEVENFIEANKHLPDVPSATQIKKDGLNLGENQAVLLRKIEELTLYAIQQEKRIEDQSVQIAKQQEQINQLLQLAKKEK